MAQIDNGLNAKRIWRFERARSFNAAREGCTVRRVPLTHIFLLCALVALAGLGAACGGDSPTAPSNPIPNVADTYTGALDFSVAGVRTIMIQARMTVVQSG